ncbi:hypothetical protein STEG23_033118, partial [Scotinomys teguina]
MTMDQLNLHNQQVMDVFGKSGPLIWKDDSTDCSNLYYLYAGEQSRAPESVSVTWRKETSSRESTLCFPLHLQIRRHRDQRTLESKYPQTSSMLSARQSRRRSSPSDKQEGNGRKPLNH